MDQSVDSALFFFPFFLVLNCTLNSLDFFVHVFCISLSLYFPLALSLRMSFLFYGSLSEGYIPALCRLMPTRTSKIIIIIIIIQGSKAAESKHVCIFSRAFTNCRFSCDSPPLLPHTDTGEGGAVIQVATQSFM